MSGVCQTRFPIHGILTKLEQPFFFFFLEMVFEPYSGIPLESLGNLWNSLKDFRKSSEVQDSWFFSDSGEENSFLIVKPFYSFGARTRQCVINSVAVDGGWSGWSSWSPCGKTCGGGLRERTRSCTNPPPYYGGKGCGNHYHESKECALNKCPG